MAMQSLGATKVVLIMGAGMMGSVLLKNSRVGDILSDLSNVLAKHLKEDGDGSGESGDTGGALAAQVRRLTQELRQLAASSRPITVVNGGPNSATGLSGLVVPVVAIGVAGYGYFWWKGWSWGDVMYVTRKNMNNAVASVSKQLEHVSAALSSTKRHLTQRLEAVTKTLDDSVAMQGLIKDQVYEVRGEVERSVIEIENVQRLVEGLEVKIDGVQAKQLLANQGIYLLVESVGSLQIPAKPELLKGVQSWLSRARQLENSSSSGAISSLAGLKEVQYISDALQSNFPAASTPEITYPNSDGEIRPIAGLGGISTPLRSMHRAFSVGLGPLQYNLGHG